MNAQLIYNTTITTNIRENVIPSAENVRVKMTSPFFELIKLCEVFPFALRRSSFYF